MPRINVTEKDLSWYYRQREKGAITVYVPGLATFGPSEPTLCDASNFTKYFGVASVDDSQDTSYHMAASYIKSGFQVLFHRILPKGAAKASDTINSKIIFTAKYEGTYGNKLRFRVRKGDLTKGRLYIFVYTPNEVLLETVTIDLLDPASQYYYATTEESQFLEVTTTGELTSEDIKEAKFVSQINAVDLDYLVLKGGSDGDTTDKTLYEQAVEAITDQEKDGTAYTMTKDLLDPYQYSFDIITSGGFYAYESEAGTTPSSVDKALFTLAVESGRAIYLVDGDKNWDAHSYYGYLVAFNSSYAAGYGPWGYQQFVDTGELRLLPGTYTLLISWANSCASGNPSWVAPAGVKRSTLGSWYRKPKYQVGKTILDEWQNNDFVSGGGYKVNPIMRAKDYGYVIYGNSTSLQNSSDGATSMLQSFSVRVLANLIKNHAFDVSLSLQFDQITGDLFLQFQALMNVFMDQLKYQGALYDYDILLGDEGSITQTILNEKTIPVRIRISPVSAAENFDISLEIHQSGITFTDDTTGTYEEGENA